MVVRYVAPTLTHFGVLMARPAARAFVEDWLLVSLVGELNERLHVSPRMWSR